MSEKGDTEEERDPIEDEHAKAEKLATEAFNTSFLAEAANCSHAKARRYLQANEGKAETALVELLNSPKVAIVVIAATSQQLEVLQEYVTLRGLGVYHVKEWDAKNYVNDAEGFYRDHVAPEEFECIVGYVTHGDGYIPLQDELNKMNGTPWNDLTTAEHRRDKLKMQELVKAANLRYAKSFECTTAEEALSTIEREFNNEYPVMLKPPTGAGTELCFKCTGPGDIPLIFSSSLKQDTTQRTVVTSFVVQEYLVGTEYVVDAVSYDGDAIFTDLWRSYKIEQTNTLPRQIAWRDGFKRKKSNGDAEEREESDSTPGGSAGADTVTFLYDNQDFVCDVDSDAVQQVIEYTRKCLLAVGILYGASHCEIMLDPVKGPCLIEANARMQGDSPRSTTLVGYDQLTLTAIMFAKIYEIQKRKKCGETSEGGGEEKYYWPPPGIPRIYRPINPDISRTVIFFISGDDGVVSEVGKEYIKKLPGFVMLTRCSFSSTPSRHSVHVVSKTVNLHTSPGAIIYEGPVDLLASNHRAIRHIENLDVESMIVTFMVEESARAGVGSEEAAYLRPGGAAISPTADFEPPGGIPPLFVNTRCFNLMKSIASHRLFRLLTLS